MFWMFVGAVKRIAFFVPRGDIPLTEAIPRGRIVEIVYGSAERAQNEYHTECHEKCRCAHARRHSHPEAAEDCNDNSPDHSSP
jgi:hypothetical protein